MSALMPVQVWAPGCAPSNEGGFVSLTSNLLERGRARLPSEHVKGRALAQFIQTASGSEVRRTFVGVL